MTFSWLFRLRCNRGITAEVTDFMTSQKPSPSVRLPLGVNGEVVAPNDLPSTRPKRWVAGRKAEILAAVEVGLLTVEEACARYGLSLDEFLLWKRAVKTAGVSGLKIKRVQDHRSRRAEGPVRKRW